MNIYLLNQIIVVLLGFYQSSRKRYLLISNRRYNLNTAIAAITVFILMLIEMGLRGDFSIDTVNYYYLYSSYENAASHAGIASYQRDLGFFQVLFAFCRRISADYLAFLIIVATIIAYSYSKFMVAYSEIFWLSALLLFCCGTFYTGFNVMRQILAASLVALSYKYLFKEEFFKFFLVIILISFIHLSAIVMIPMYFVLTRRWDLSNNKYLKIMCIVVVCGLFYICAPAIFEFVSRYVYTNYRFPTAYGVSFGIGILGTLKAFVLAGGVIVNSKFFNFSDPKERVIYNGCVVYLIIAACGANIFMVQRFVHYFIPCLLVAYPHIISRIQNRKSKQFYVVLVASLFIFSGLNIVLDPDYYFYWNNQIIRW